MPGNPIIMEGKSVAASLNGVLAQRIAKLKSQGITPGLTAVLVGEDDASQIYVRNKARACERLGLNGNVIRLPDSTSESELLELVDLVVGNLLLESLLNLVD